ncbi:MAG: efflux RND transporter periplasmic adaptor subunit [Acidobacteriota bacterium]|nr:efflux RND transporter periplasmic adaptor subunit [Acidobacteriota bacterium]
MSGINYPGNLARGGVRRPRRRESGRGVVIAIVVLAVVAAIVIAGIVPRFKARAALKTETRELAIPTVAVIHAKPGDPRSEIVLPGNMQAFADSPIYARTNGYLKAWYHDIGSRVKKGDLLAVIESPEVDQQLDQARAELSTAQANFALARTTAERYQNLLKSGSVAKQDVDNAVGDFEAKKATVDSAEANVKRLEQLQSFEKVYAPFDGVITARNTDVGHLINSGAGSPATELFHISSIRKLRVYVNVPQQNSASARPGLRAAITLPEFPGRHFSGTLVRTSESIDAVSRTLLAEVDVDNPTGELLPGAYAEVHFQIPNAAPALMLPVSSLIFRSQGMQVGTVDSGSRTVLKTITLGRDFGNEVEVIAGLDPGDSVIVNPPDSLVAGELVRVVSSREGDGQGTSGAAQ